MTALDLQLRTTLGAHIDRGRQAKEELRRLGWTSDDDAWDEGGGPYGQARYYLACSHIDAALLAQVLLDQVDDHRPDEALFESTIVCSSPMCVHELLHGTHRYTPYPCGVTRSIATSLHIPLDEPPRANLALVKTATP